MISLFQGICVCLKLSSCNTYRVLQRICTCRGTRMKMFTGGVIIFDEYEYHKFSESVGVEKFLKERNIDYSLKSTNWVAPTAFMVKKGF